MVPILPEDKPFRAPGHMVTPYPDYRHYTSREYGTRVGFYRMLDACARDGARVSVAANGAIAARYSQVIPAILAEGHELVAHYIDLKRPNGTGMTDAPGAAVNEGDAAI